jgi:hypothetical protein
MNLLSEMYSTVRKGMPSVVKVCSLEIKDKREEDGKMVSSGKQMVEPHLRLITKR